MFTIALSTLCISAGVTASLYLALPNLNFMSSKVPDMFKPNLNGTGDFEDGNMIVKVHIQSLRTPYRRFVTVHRNFKRIDCYFTVSDTNFAEILSIKFFFLFLKKNFFEISAKVSPSISTRLSPFT